MSPTRRGTHGSKAGGPGCSPEFCLTTLAGDRLQRRLKPGVRRRLLAPPFRLDSGGALGVYVRAIDMRIELDREEDGRWLREIWELPGVMADS